MILLSFSEIQTQGQISMFICSRFGKELDIAMKRYSRFLNECVSRY